VVAVKQGDAERFVNAPPESVFLFLMFGADAGLVRERALRLADKRVDDRRDPFQFVEMSGDAVSADPLTLLDEANTVPLFGGRRVLLVETGAKSVIPAVEMLLAAPPADCAVILTAGALKWDSALRKLVEGSKLGAAIECQPDSEGDLRALIERTLHEAGLTASPEALGLLRTALGEDRLMSRAELAKLTLYMHGRHKVEAGDVEAIVAQASNVAADRVVLDAFSGRMDAAGAGFDHVVAQGGDGSQLLFGAMRYALALHRAKLAADKGGAGAGVTALKRAGFAFMHHAMMESHLKNWPLSRLAAMIEPLRAAQARARAHSGVARMEAARALLRIAQAAGRR
jgi:DNA polymerase-3 subunit delta